MLSNLGLVTDLRSFGAGDAAARFVDIHLDALAGLVCD